MATRLGNMAVGSTVKIKVDGTLKDFIIVHQGKPSSIYDDSCNGTWVLMKALYTLRRWDQRNTNYSSSDISYYLKNSFFNLLESGCRSAIKSVKIPYVYDETVHYGANGLPVKVFLLSARELGWSTENSSIYNDGSDLSMFSNYDASSNRVAYYQRNSKYYWTRSAARNYSEGVFIVTSDGDNEVKSVYVDDVGVRPAFILPKEQLVSSNGTIIWNQPPEVTSDAGATGAELGEKNAPFAVGYTVTDKDGDLMTVTEKLDGEVKQTRTEVPSETALTVDWLKEKAGYQQVLNGSHTITLTVGDGKTSVDWTATFTKNVTGAQVSLTAPLTADDTITVAALTLEGSFPADMSLSVKMTNNALDDSPVWENCTDIQRGESRAFVHHVFTNKTAARGFAFNYKVTIARGASGVGGNITMIGGVIG